MQIIHVYEGINEKRNIAVLLLSKGVTKNPTIYASYTVYISLFMSITLKVYLHVVIHVCNVLNKFIVLLVKCQIFWSGSGLFYPFYVYKIWCRPIFILFMCICDLTRSSCSSLPWCVISWTCVKKQSLCVRYFVQRQLW